MRHQWLLLSLTVLLGMVGILLPVLFPSPSRITRGNYDRITLGMTRREVEALLGGPPGDYRNEPPEMYRGIEGDPIPLEDFNQPDEHWMGDEGIIGLRFGNGAVVLQRDWGIPAWQHDRQIPPPKPVSILERVRWRLKRGWERWSPWAAR